MDVYYLIVYYMVLHGCAANFTSSNKNYDMTNIFLPSFRNDTATLPEIPGVIYKNITIDVENVDIDKMKNKLETMQKRVMDMDDMKDTRRQSLLYTDGSFKTASDYMTRAKISDLMLQTIYMARQKINSIEPEIDEYKKDPTYRIGYLNRMMRRILSKIMFTLEKMRNHEYFVRCTTSYSGSWANSQQVHKELLLMHVKSVKLHTDFLYVWKVYMNLDEIYKEGQNKTLVDRYGGITDDSHENVG